MIPRAKPLFLITRFAALLIFLLAFPALALFSQAANPESESGLWGLEDNAGIENGDDFGFGNETPSEGSFGFGDEAPDSSGGNLPSVKIGGELSASLLFFTEDLESSEKRVEMELGNIFTGSLNVTATGENAEGIINVKIRPEFSGESPVSLDEAYLRLYLGPVDIEGGLRKLTWGRADSFGPLDVINPIDYTDLSNMGNPRGIKIARPMLHASWNIGAFSRLEGVFVPWFAGNEYAMSGRWAPGEIAGTAPLLVEGLKAEIPVPSVHTDLDSWLSDFRIEDYYRNTNKTLEYAQAGLRFSSTIGVSDFGIQYYFGRFPRPAFTVDIADFVSPLLQDPPALSNVDTDNIHILIDYNYYHQIGFDWARVIAGFNVRAETGFNITGDLDGVDGEVYNPQFIWSLGFDRDVIWGINLNLQGNGLVRLMYDEIGSDPLSDTEAEKDRSSTRITAILSKMFFRDELEIKTTALWGIEDKDFLVIPAIVWSRNDITAELSAGFFGGDNSGELGQYRDNAYVKTVLGWSF